MGRGTFLWILIFYFRYSLPPLHFNSKAGTQMQIDIKLNLFIYIYIHIQFRTPVLILFSTDLQHPWQIIK